MIETPQERDQRKARQLMHEDLRQQFWMKTYLSSIRAAGSNGHAYNHKAHADAALDAFDLKFPAKK